MTDTFSIKNELFASALPDYPFRNILDKSLAKILAIDTLDELYRMTCSTPGSTFIEKILKTLNVSVNISEKDLAHIPESGSCIIVCNHPFGGIEGILIASVLQKLRPDFKILANYFIGLIPELRDMFIFVDPFARKDSTVQNIAPLKQAFKWIKNGGLLVLFPAGAVSHLKITKGIIIDPPWQQNMGRFIEKANVPVIPVFFEGSNKLPFQTMGLIHPFLRTLLLPGELINKRNMTFNMSIGNVVTTKKLNAYRTTHERLQYLHKRTYNLANRYPAPENTLNANDNTFEKIAAAPDPQQLIREYQHIPQAQMLFRQKKQTVFYANAYQIPNLLYEIARQREITFREVNEGTGKSADCDHYDDYYLHLVAWDEEYNRIIGAYRMGLSDLILQDFGKKGLYSYSLFKMKSSYFKQMQPAIELGRSFIVRAYQRQFNALFLLWRGIGEFIVCNKRYRYLFGPVSISSTYKTTSQKLLLEYLLKFHKNEKLSQAVKARNFKKKSLKVSKFLPAMADQFPELEDMIGDIENEFNGVPILIRQYLKLGAEFIAFNLDPLFNNVIDGLIVVDLCKSERKTLNRYMGAEGTEQFYKYHKKRDELINKHKTRQDT